jgi:thioester reductase-like protein
LLESVVVGRDDAGGEKRLVAYYTVAEPAGERLAGKQYLRADELRDYLSQSLPEYMVPAAYVRLQKLPLTADGKVDRTALPALEEGAFSVKAYEPPQGEIETIIAGVWADLLKVEAVGRRDNFFALGGRSLLAVQLAARLRQGLGMEVGVDALFAWPVLSDFARVVESARQSGLSAITRADQGEQFPAITRDLCAEAVLDANITRVSLTPAATPAENIFLTGATGFLGSFLLADLLKHTKATVHCLVRSSTAEEGLATLSAKLKSFDLWDAAKFPRVLAVPGDLSKPRLGLTSGEFETMAEIIDAIYHSAAMVNAAYGYDFVKSANVLGTQEIIRMACLGRRKALHHISTLSVFPPFLHPEEAGPVPEETLLERWREIPDGYGQSKWVAERVVEAAGSRGVPFTIYRPCFISGSLQSAAGNPSDFLSLFITACLRLGCAPYTDAEIDDSQSAINMLPVDYMSRAILALSQRQEALGRSLNLTHERPVSFRNISDSLVSWGRSYGFPIKEVSFESWRDRCHATEELNALQIFFPAAHSSAPQTTGDRVEVKMDSETDRLLQAEGLHRPAISQDLMERYITYLAKGVCQGESISDSRSAELQSLTVAE